MIRTIDIPTTVDLLTKIIAKENKNINEIADKDKIAELLSLRIYGILLLGLTILQDGKAKILLNTATRVLNMTIIAENEMKYDRNGKKVTRKRRMNANNGNINEKHNAIKDFTAALSQITYPDNKQNIGSEEKNSEIELDNELFNLEELEMALEMDIENTPDISLPSMPSISSLSSLLARSSTSSRVSPGLTNDVMVSLLNETTKMQGDSIFDGLDEDQVPGYNQISDSDDYDHNNASFSMSPGAFADSLFSSVIISGKGNNRKRRRKIRRGNGEDFISGIFYEDEEEEEESFTENFHTTESESNEMVGMNKFDKTLLNTKDNIKVNIPKSKRRPHNVLDAPDKIILSTSQFRKFLESAKQVADAEEILNDMNYRRDIKNINANMSDTIKASFIPFFGRCISSSFVEAIDLINSKLLEKTNKESIKIQDQEDVNWFNMFDEDSTQYKPQNNTALEDIDDDEAHESFVMRGESIDANYLASDTDTIINPIHPDMSPDTATPLWTEQLTDEEKDTANIGSLLSTFTSVNKRGELVFGGARRDAGATRGRAARLFFELLRRNSRGQISMSQETPFGPITIRLSE